MPAPVAYRLAENWLPDMASPLCSFQYWDAGSLGAKLFGSEARLLPLCPGCSHVLAVVM
jgi:hypothetical protein